MQNKKIVSDFVGTVSAGSYVTGCLVGIIATVGWRLCHNAGPKGLWIGIGIWLVFMGVGWRISSHFSAKATGFLRNTQEEEDNSGSIGSQHP